MVHAWSNPANGINSVLVNPDATPLSLNGFLALFVPGDCMDGLVLQYCFLRRAAAPASWRSLKVCWPASGCLGVSLFLLFGLGRRPVGTTDV